MVRTFDRPSRPFAMAFQASMAGTALLGFLCGSLGGIFFCSAAGLL